MIDPLIFVAPEFAFRYLGFQTDSSSDKDLKKSIT